MSLTDDVKSFIVVHRVHGTVTTKASAGTDAGYGLRLMCTCGQHYFVFVTPEMAAQDFLAQAERNCQHEPRRSGSSTSRLSRRSCAGSARDRPSPSRWPPLGYGGPRGAWGASTPAAVLARLSPRDRDFLQPTGV